MSRPLARAARQNHASPLPANVAAPRGATRRKFLRTSLALAAGSAVMQGLGVQIFSQEKRPVWVTGNETIDQPREIALGMLKPTPAQLDRAWKLHFESLVFESYGFAPRCALDGKRFQEAVEAGAGNDELSDLREEMMMNGCATNERERKEYFDAFRAAGVTCLVQNAGEEGSDPLRLLKRLAHFTKATDLLKPELTKAVVPDDVVAAKKAGRICLCFTGNGVPLRQQWISVRDELRLVRVFHELGIRMMHLTYNRRNPIGDGAGEPNDGGLSDFGKSAVAEMNRVGVIVDVAHSGWRTSLEGAKASSRPMVASHTTCADLYRHIRAKPDEVIRAICDTGGLVGICCISNFLGGDGDIHSLLNHIDHVAKKFGVDHVAIGTDIAYVSRYEAEERAKVPKRPDGTSPLSLSGARWEHLWPKDLYKTTPEATKSIAWTNWPLYTVGLVMRGYSDDEIRKILGGNMLRVFTANSVV